MRNIACVASLAVLTAAFAGCGKSSPTEPTPAPCTYSLSPTSLTIGSGGGAGSVTVTTGASCAWTAVSDRGWMAITNGASGTGSGAVSVSLTANANTAERSGMLTIAGQAVAVRQDGAAACTLDISPQNASFGRDAGAGTFSVTAPGQCQWSATSAVPWLTVTAGNTGTGNGTVTYAVARNSETTPRTGTFGVIQVSDPITCGGATQEKCRWEARSDVAWITITTSMPQAGDNPVAFTVSPNTGGAPRTGTIAVADKVVRIAQSF